MKRIFSPRFTSIFSVLLRLAAVLLLLAPMFASVPPTPVKALNFPAEINKSFTPDAILAGQTSKLRVTIYNPNAFPLYDATWTDNLPVGITIVTPLNVTHNCGTGSVTAVGGGTSFVLVNGDVPAQVGATPGQCYVEIDVTSVTPGNLINTIGVGLVNGLDAKGMDGGSEVSITNTTPASATLNVVSVSPPTVNKNFAPNTISVGGTSTLTINLINTDASATLHDATLTDFLPADLVVASLIDLTNCGPGTATVIPNTQVTLNDADIAPGATCVIRVNVTSSVQKSYTNTIFAGPGGPGSVRTREGVTNASAATATLNVQAFTVTKAFAPASIPAGNTSTLTITIQNRANFAYNNVSFYDNLAEVTAHNRLEFVGGTATFASCGPMAAAVSNTGAPSTVNNRADFTGGTIAAGVTCTITISVRALQSTPAGAYTNRIPAGRITTTEGATNDVQVSTNLTVTNPLSIAKDITPASIPSGTTTVLTITISNTSALPYTVTTLTDNLAAPTNSRLSVAATPAESTTCAGGVVTALPAATTVTLTGGTIPASGSCTITVTLTGTLVGGPYTNTIPPANFSTAEGGTIPAAPVVSDTVTITGVNPTVGKVFTGAYGNNNIVPGGTDTLTITITNPVGATALTGIHLVDNLAATNLVIAAAPAATTTCTGVPIPPPAMVLTAAPGTQLIDLTGATLAGGSPAHSCTITVPVTLPMGAYGSSVTNTIPIANFTNDQGIGITTNTTRTLNIRAVDVLSKTFTPATIAVGGTSSLVITLQNFTGSVLTVNTLTDTLPAQLSVAAYPPATAPSTTCGGSPVITAVAGTQAISMSGGTIPVGTLPNTYTNYGSCTVTIPVTSTTVGGHTNTIQAVPPGLTTVEGPVSVTARSATLTVIATNSPVTLTKTYGTNPVAAGANSLMTLTINAPADTSLTNFSITDTFPTNMVVGNPTGASVVSGCGAGAFSPAVVSGAGSITVNNATINIGTPCIIRVNVTGTLGGSYPNTIHPGDITNASVPPRTIAANVTATLNVTAVSTLNVTKNFQPTIVQANGLSTLTIYFENTSTSQLDITTITDNLPGNATDGVVVAPVGIPSHAITTCPGATFNPATGDSVLTVTGGYIPPKIGGTNGLCRITVDVQGKRTSAALPAVHNNNILPATVSVRNHDTGETMTSTGTATASLTIDALTMEVVKKFDPQLVYGGSASTLSVTLRNPNPSAALTGIKFTDTMPAGMIIATPANLSEGGCGGALTGNPGDGSFSFDGGILAAGIDCKLTLSVTMTVNGNLTNTIGIGAVTTFNGVHNTTATAASLTNLAGASVSKAFSPGVITAGPVGPGSVSTLTITIKNTTTLTLTGMGLIDTLPLGLTIAPAPASSTTCGAGTLVTLAGTPHIELIGGDLAGNSSCTIIVPVTSSAPGLYTNTIPKDSLITNEGASNHEPAVDDLEVTGYSLGNRVWDDNGANPGAGGVANDGIRNGSEPGIDGVTVNLYLDHDNNGTPDGGIIATMPTAGGGYYRFDELAPDTYIVEVVTPAGYVTSPVNGGDPDTLDLDDDNNGVIVAATTVRSNPVTLGTGASEPTNDNDPLPNPAATLEEPNDQSNRTVDFAFTSVYSLGNRVWEDNGAGGGVADDGLLNGTEPGLNGITVNLYLDHDDNGVPDGGVIRTMPTAGGGYYRFDNLLADTYIVEVVTPAGYTSSSVDGGDADADDDPDTDLDDSDDNGVVVAATTVRSNPVTLGPGAVEPTGDNDPALNPDTVGGEAADNRSNRTVDFGFYFPPYSLGNRVWDDNGAGGGVVNDGLLNGSEPGLNGITVNLYLDHDNNGTPDGGIVRTMPTAGGGYYRFDNLMADTYIVEVVTPAGYLSSTVDGGDADADDDPDTDLDDSDDNGVVVAATTVRSNPVTLGPGAVEPTGDNDPLPNPAAGEAADDRSNRTVDFGFILGYSLGNRIWDDNGAGGGVADDGLLNGTEPGLNGITVNLYLDHDDNGAPDGGVIRTMPTAGGGYYRFDGLASDTYIVEVVTPAGYLSSTVDGGDADADDDPDTDLDDSDDNGVVVAATTVRSNPVTLGPGAVEPTGDNDPALNPDTVGGEAPDNRSNRTVDFGFTLLYSLGNRVWFDANNNGLLDAGEAGIVGVNVNLYKDDGTTPGVYDAGDTPVGVPQPTGAGGYYRFDGLTAGDYVVVVPAANFTGAGVLVGYWSSGTIIASTGVVSEGVTPDPDALPETDSDDNGVSSFTANTLTYVSAQAVTLGPGATEPIGDNDPTHNPALTGEAPNNLSNRTVDFGFFPLASLGDYVWSDVNSNGIQDAGEPGIVGVTVNLYRPNYGPDGILGTLDDADIVRTMPTAGGGLYAFTSLTPGDYYVEFIPPLGSVFTLSDQGANDARDSDANPATGRTIITTLVGGENDLSWDAGLNQKAALGNFVWSDTNGNGIQDAGEPGIDGVTVNLYRGGGALAGSTTTMGGGFYAFTGLNPGDYYVEFIPPLGYVFSPPDQGADDKVDSDVNPGSGRTIPTTLVAGENDVTWDAGLINTLAALGNFVWSDVNKDGIQGAGEPGIPGVTVNLLNPTTGATLATINTDTNGFYGFTGLTPGNYQVQFILPGGYIFSPQDVGADTSDSDANPANAGKTGTYTLVAGAADLTVDAGMYRTGGGGLAALGDYVWFDTNHNGIQDAGEPGVNGVTVELFTKAGVSQGTRTTSGGGQYLFTDLTSGDYYVVFTLPGGYKFSPQNAGGDLTRDSNADTTTGQTAVVTLAAGERNLTIDAGIYNEKAALGDYVWLDTNRDGVQDASETGVDGVKVELFTAAGASQGSRTTAGGGKYLFTGLEPGDYYVVFTLPGGHVFSPRNMGGDASRDSNPDTATGRTAVVTLPPSGLDLTIDAGIYNDKAALGDYVWFDTNHDGIQDASESGVDGVKVELFNGAGVSQGTKSTAGGGKYLFTDLTPGDYYVVFTPPAGYIFSPQNMGGDVARDSNPDTTTGRTAVVTLAAGDWNLTIDAGIYNDILAALGDTVWMDDNHDGIQDVIEPGVDDVKVELFNGAGMLLGSKLTAGGGKYLFTALLPGDYYVVFTLPTGYVFSPRYAGATDKDSNPDTTTGKTDTVRLAAGEVNLTIDAGIYSSKLAGLGDYVWFDINRDGVQDASETSVDGVTVELFTGAGVSKGAKLTAGGGKYLFTGLEPGDYYVVFTLPTDYAFTLQNAGGDTARDSNADTLTGKTAVVTLAAGDLNLTIDAGLILTKPMIGIAKRVVDAPRKVSPGIWDVTYEILVRNYGGVPVTNLQVTDSLDATFPLPTTFTVQSLASSSFKVNWPGYDGSKNINLLAGTDTLPIGGEGRLTLVVRVIPAVACPPFKNSAASSGILPTGGNFIDISQNGPDPAPGGGNDPLNHNEPTPVCFEPGIIDPPLGFKTFDDSGLPVLKWTMVWINQTNMQALSVKVSDPIVEGTTYAGGLTCLPAPGAVGTTTSICAYEPPSVTYPRGRVVWEGTLGPDIGHTTPETAVNEIYISFNVTVDGAATNITNCALMDADLNQDGDFDDPGEKGAAIACSTTPKEPEGGGTSKTKKLPATGFAPGIVSFLPAQPEGLAYKAYSDLRVEIPSLNVNVDIVGVPWKNDDWDITWLGGNAGYLDGTAFPTWLGNSVITGHVYAADGLPGPFVNLGKLKWGDQIVIHAFGEKYIYEVRLVRTISPYNNSVLGHKDEAWVTLLTCKDYNDLTGQYKMRTAVQAVLVTVVDE